MRFSIAPNSNGSTRNTCRSRPSKSFCLTWKRSSSGRGCGKDRRRAATRVVCAYGGFDSSANALAWRFHDVGARIFHRRFRLRGGGAAKNSGRMSGCRQCWRSWRTRLKASRIGTTTLATRHCAALATAEGVKAGLLINATRVAIVGRAVAPPLFETMVVLGKERVVARLRRALPAVSAR